MPKSISIVLTIHNKGFLLERVLQKIKQYTTGNYELIMVVDGCTDNSLQICEQFQKSYHYIESKIIETPNIYETKANNTGAKLAAGEIVIFLQDDVILKEYNWNGRLTLPFKMDDVFAVSGRMAHNWQLNTNSSYYNNPHIKDTGWCDLLTAVNQASKEHNTPRSEFAIRDSVIRAPLAIKKADLQKMGYLDESFYPQDCDDHDLCYRMHKKLKKVVGCFWIEFESDLKWGGTRDENGNTKPWLFAAQNKNAQELWTRHADRISQPTVETRTIL